MRRDVGENKAAVGKGRKYTQQLMAAGAEGEGSAVVRSPCPPRLPPSFSPRCVP